MKVVEKVILELENMRDVFERQSLYCFFASSILIMYEEEDEEKAVTVKLIDFTHSYNTLKEEERDENFLYGLRSLIDVIRSLK